MKTLNLALGLAAGLAVAASACASAADVTPLTYDWTGFYLGAQAGYGWGDNTFTYVGGVGPPQENVDVSGLVGGATLGANRQFGNIVLGLEGDISYSGISGETLSATRPCIAEGCTEDVDWFGTGRVRLGYAMDQILPFVSGGLAIGNISGSADIGACDPRGTECKFDDVKLGWTLGAGLETALGENWTAKAEYLYVNLGRSDFTNPVDVKSGDVDFSLVRLGVNRRF